MSNMHIHCLCGKFTENIFKIDQEGDAKVEICHCYGCRHSTGLLYSSYVPVNGDEANSLIQRNDLVGYEDNDHPSDRLTLYFCKTCGSQIFRTIQTGNGTVTGVASGVVASIDGHEGLNFGPQINAVATADGGIAKWMHHLRRIESNTQHFSENSRPCRAPEIAASCICHTVKFRLTPPNANSFKPHSGFPDAMIPFHTNNPEIKNPRDVKWWLRENNTKYAASLCACKTCRLASGFELQAWAFVPKTNIEFQLNTDGTWSTLDFDALRERGIISTYDSSPGVQREFCPRCGATLFWRDKWRPGLIDVSVGLLHSQNGARVEDLLDWTLQRVSFAEDAPLGRNGAVAVKAEEFVNIVEQNMKHSAQLDI